MNELITKCLDNEIVHPLTEFPSELLNENEKKVLSLIFKYCEKYKSTPSAEYISNKVDTFVEMRSIRPMPIEAIFEDTLKRKLLTGVAVLLGEAESVIEEEKKIPIDLLHQILRLSMLESGELLYSTFDRKKYFRTGANFPLGFSIIDKTTGGLYNGDFGLLIGRLGTKKTTISQWVAKKWWELGKRVLYISTEMLAADIFSRLDGMTTKFNPLLIREGSRPELVKSYLADAKKNAEGKAGEIIVPSKRILTVSEIAAHAVSTMADAIIIDGLYLLREGNGNLQRWERVAAVSNAVKQLALDLQKPILATTQIKRVGAKDEYEPEDIAYSDALGQDADFIIAIKPDEVYSDKIELQLIKNRFGPEIASIARIDFDQMQIYDISASGKEVLSLKPPKEGRLW